MFDLATIQYLNKKADEYALKNQRKPLQLCDINDLFYKVPAEIPFVGTQTFDELTLVERFSLNYTDFKSEQQPASFVTDFKSRLKTLLETYKNISVAITNRSTISVEFSVWIQN